MDKERYQRIRQVFLEARELPAAARPGCLEIACADDQDLRATVEQLLADEEQGTRFLGRSVLDGHAHIIDTSPPPDPPAQ